MSNYLNPRGPSTGEFVRRSGSSLPVKNKRRGGLMPQFLLVGSFAAIFVGILQMKDSTKKEDNKKQSNPDSVGLVAEVPQQEQSPTMRMDPELLVPPPSEEIEE